MIRRTALPAALAVVTAIVAWATMPAFAIPFAAAFAALAAFIAEADVRSFEIPDEANIALFAVGLAWAALGAPPSSLPLTPALVFDTAADTPAWAGPAFGVIDGVARSFIAGGTLLAVRAFYRGVRGIEGLGLGDVKLAASAAPWLTWPDLPTALFVAVLGALLATLGSSLLARRPVDGAAWIPLGAFLAPAAFVVWMLRLAGLPLGMTAH